MSRSPLMIALLSACLITAAPAAQAGQSPLELSLVRGGALQADPVARGDLVYLPTGRVISTWAYDDADAPLHLSDSAPASGPINGLVLHGDHLYASWRGLADGGVAVWSLADPLNPQLVAEYDDYTDQARRPFGVAVANDHLFLFDHDRGVFVTSLEDPGGLQLSPTPITRVGVGYTSTVTHGDLIHATGRNFVGQTVLHVYDASVPHAPVRVANHAFDGLRSFSLVMDPEQVIGVGNFLDVYDLEDPQLLEPRGSIGIPTAYAGARVDGYAYTFGAGTGLDVWDVSDADAPGMAGHLDIRSFSARRSVQANGQVIIPTETDLMVSLDVARAGMPAAAATAWNPGAVGAMEAVGHGDHLLMVHSMYGLTVNDPDTLEPVARFEADLPEQVNNRVFYRMALLGDTAHLAAWGYGMINVDLSDPANPVEIGRLPFPFASVVAAEGGYAYLAKNTNGPLLGVADVSDPAAPALAWQAELPSRPHQARVHDGHLYLAETHLGTAPAHTGGVRVFSLADPAAPVEVTRINDGCGTAFDLAIDTEVPLAYVACDGSMQVLDIGDPAAPAVVGRYQAQRASDYSRVVQQGDRAWFSDVDGLHQLDVTNPTAPALIKLSALGGIPPESLSIARDGRLLAMGNTSGVHVFAPADDNGGGAAPIQPGVPVTGLEAEAGEALAFSIEVPEGADVLQILTYGGSGDVDLLVRHGQPPTADEHDAASSRPGNNETVRIRTPAAGTWYIRLVGTRAFRGVSLQARL